MKNAKKLGWGNLFSGRLFHGRCITLSGHTIPQLQSMVIRKPVVHGGGKYLMKV